MAYNMNISRSSFLAVFFFRHTQRSQRYIIIYASGMAVWIREECRRKVVEIRKDHLTLQKGKNHFQSKELIFLAREFRQYVPIDLLPLKIFDYDNFLEVL